MVSKILRERLMELHKESPIPLRLLQYTKGTYNYKLHVGTIVGLAQSRELIPVVLYAAEGTPQLLDLEDIANVDIGYYIGRVTKERRESLGLKQQELAEKAGTYSTALCRYEKGIWTPTVDLFEVICQCIGLKPEYLTKEIRQLPLPFDK